MAGDCRRRKGLAGSRSLRRADAGCDAALASLDLAVLWLKGGRTAEVRQLAVGMAWIFNAQGIHREALAALSLFCEAAQQETATTELARRLGEYLCRARHDPELRFEG